MVAAEDPTPLVIGLPPMEGPAPRLRLSYVGTWDPPVFITVTFSNPEPTVSVIDPGPDAPRIIRECLFEGAEPRQSPSREERTGRLEPRRRARLGAHLRRTAWTLTDRPLSGTDGAWFTAEVHEPDRGCHRARAWSPPANHPMTVFARDMVDAALDVDPSLAERPWVRELRDHR